jgi:hypothetical protein
VYSGHYPRIFGAPKNAQKAETKRQSGAVPILLLVIPALATSTYSSLKILQELNPRPQLLKALVYHSATSAVIEVFKDLMGGDVTIRCEAMLELGVILFVKGVM